SSSAHRRNGRFCPCHGHSRRLASPRQGAGANAVAPGRTLVDDDVSWRRFWLRTGAVLTVVVAWCAWALLPAATHLNLVTPSDRTVHLTVAQLSDPSSGAADYSADGVPSLAPDRIVRAACRATLVLRP